MESEEVEELAKFIEIATCGKKNVSSTSIADLVIRQGYRKTKTESSKEIKGRCIKHNDFYCWECEEKEFGQPTPEIPSVEDIQKVIINECCKCTENDEGIDCIVDTGKLATAIRNLISKGMEIGKPKTMTVEEIAHTLLMAERNGRIGIMLDDNRAIMLAQAIHAKMEGE